VDGILSKNNRVLALIGALALGSFVVGGIVYAVSRDQAAELAAMSTRIARLDALANTMSTEVNHAEDALGDYVLSGDAIARKGFDDAVTNQAAAANDFRAVAAGIEPVQSALARLEVASLDWRDRIAMPAIRGVEAGDAGAIDAFRAQSAADRVGIDDALGSLDRELARQHAAIELRRAEIGGTTIIGVVIGFGFMTLAFGVAIVAVRRFGRALERDARDASVLNRFTELTSFADEDRQVAAANLVALGRLAGPDASVTHILRTWQPMAGLDQLGHRRTRRRDRHDDVHPAGAGDRGAAGRRRRQRPRPRRDDGGIGQPVRHDDRHRAIDRDAAVDLVRTAGRADDLHPRWSRGRHVWARGPLCRHH
jgi:hypothetical protein